ncbi:MAG: hypothetical protein K2X84_17385, partial [Beijerinckiaceae bacterium]|nr:hypothetical protein [Beijerinckiaceae bacterium]
PLLWEFPLQEHGLFVVRPPGAYVPGKVRVLIDLLVERFGGAPYWDPCQAAARERGVTLGFKPGFDTEAEDAQEDHQPA